MKKNSSKIDNSKFHKSVLLNEVIMHLAPKNGETYLDATFGAGGYSSAILESAKCHVYGVDRDESAKKFAAQLKKNSLKTLLFYQENSLKAKVFWLKKVLNKLMP